MIARLRWLGVLALLSCGLGCAPESGPATKPAEGSARGFDVVLVTLDTVRQDHLGCYGDALASTPTIDGLAQRGVRFEQAVTAAPLTLPSHSTLMTGLNPPRTGVHDNGIDRLDEDNETFAEVAHREGYQTAAFVGCFVLDARFGLNQGFDVYDFAVSAAGLRTQMADFNERSALEVTDAALAWLRERKRDTPYFLWVHYFDAHLPYQSPLAREPRFADRPYDAEIAFVDQQLGRLLESVDPKRTIIVVAADHGEALGDHGEPTHGLFLYESTVRVPLIVAGPVAPSVVEDRVVGLVDVKRTLEYLLAFTSEAETDGVNLFDETESDRAVYMETEAPIRLGGWSELAALRWGDRKYIDAPIPEFYELRTDPSESDNRWSAAKHGPLRERVSNLRHEGRRLVTSDPLSDEERARLEALGYVQADAVDEDRDRPDPKIGLDAYLAALESERLYAEGRYQEAADVAGRAVASNPDLVQAVRVLAFCHLRLGRPEAALALLEETADRRPDPYLLRSFAQALILENRLDEARKVLDRYESIAPADGRVPLLRGDILVTEGRPAAAAESYREAKQRDPRRVGAIADRRIQRLPSSQGGE